MYNVSDNFLIRSSIYKIDNGYLLSVKITNGEHDYAFVFVNVVKHVATMKQGKNEFARIFNEFVKETTFKDD